MKTLTLLCCLLFPMIAFGQLAIISSSPADGAVNVPLTTTVSFTFNLPLDTTADFSGYPISFAGENPMPYLHVTGISFSPDLITVLLSVVHDSVADYCWIVIGARSQDGHSLSVPFALNYSTTPTHGLHTISGTVSMPGYELPEHFLVAALAGYPFSDYSPGRSATIAHDHGLYTLPYLRDGYYWLLAAADMDSNGVLEEGEPIGCYDPDSNGHADSVVVAGADLQGIDFTIDSLPYVPARFYLQMAESLAATVAPDQELKSIWTHHVEDSVNHEGLSLGWTYEFFSPWLVDSVTYVDIDGHGHIYVQAEAPPNMLTIPSDFLDSPVADSVADQNGGTQFCAQHLVTEWSFDGGTTYTQYYWDPTAIYWHVMFVAHEQGTEIAFHAFVDMITGELLWTGITGVSEGLAGTLPQQYALYQNYPNPFNAITTISYDLPKSAHISLRVFDLLGRQVAVLKDGMMEAGSHRVTFDGSSLASGIYFARLDAGKFSQTKKLMLLK
jgi:hypothetical protein